ncbi:hypothetical protein ACPVPU_07355 [Sphingomonas sp. CJ99]
MTAAFDPLRVQLVTSVTLAMSAPDIWVVPGPHMIVVAGVAVPVLSAGFGIVGIGLGQLLAPPVTMGLRRRVALIAALLGIELGIVIATGQQPLVAMAWGIGLGFSGLAVAEALGSAASDGVRRISGAFITAISARLEAKKKDDSNA